MIRIFFILTFFMVLAACVSRINPEEDKARILEADREFSRYSVQHGTSNAFYRFMDEEGVVLPKSGYPLIGREAYGKQISSPTEAGSNSTLKWEPDLVKISHSGDLGYTFGRYELTAVDELGKETKTYGHYITIWKKQPDGSWKFVFDTGNENPSLKEDWLDKNR